MERFVVREPRTNAGYPPNHQVMGYQENPGNMLLPEAVYYQKQYGSEFPGMQRGGNMNTGFVRVVHANATSFPPGMNVPVAAPGQTQVMSGIDPNYLAAYANNNATYGSTGGQREPQMQMQSADFPVFGANYQNCNYVGPDRVSHHTFPAGTGIGNAQIRKEVIVNKAPIQSLGSGFHKENVNRQPVVEAKKHVVEQRTKEITQPVGDDSKKSSEATQLMSRADKLKALHKSGTRAFSGPVEKVLKWQKPLQELGILVIYEVMAKCMNIRSGDSSAKYLLVRDENGPAMQVVYYEIDFLLPELKPPCTVRLVGRFMPGTMKFQAFNIRPATGDDMATLPRRAAVASHHVAKLCKEFGLNNLI